MIGDIKKFRFWCQKVLPLVYDDSLSYYEILCKVVDYLNKVIADVNSIPDYINSYIDERLSDEHIQELLRAAIKYLEDAISKDNEADNTNFSKDYSGGDLIWWNDKFYRVTRDVEAGDTILDSVTNPNVEEISFAELFNEFIAYLKTLFTNNDEDTNTNASRNFSAGEFVWINDLWYEVTKAITEGNSFIYSGENQNVEPINIDSLIHALRKGLADEASAREDADVVLQTNINNEAQAREDADGVLQTNINNEAQARENADGVLQTNINNEAQARENADGALRDYVDESIDNMSKYKETYINVKTLGAIGDGTLHLLSEKYATLEEAQVDYPFVSALTVSIDYAVIQKALNENTTVYIPQGTYIIDTTIIIPQTRFQVVNGDGSRLTFLKGVGNDLVMFNYERDTASAGKTLTFNDVAIITDSNNVTGIKYHGVIVDNLRYEDNYLNVMRCYLNGPERCFDLYAAGNCHFDYIDAANCGRIILLRRAASFIHGSKIFAMSCKSLLYAEDNLHDGVSNGIELQECEAIFSTDSSFRVNGWQGVYLHKCSADLCASAIDQIFLYNCADCAITDSWVAGQDATSSIGLRIWASKDISVKGCTFQNVDFGCRIDGLPGYDTATVIDACVFEGCNRNDVLLSGVFGVTLVNNTFLDAIPLTGTDAPVYASVADDCIITLNRFKSAGYTVTLGTNSIAASNIFNITNP